MIRTHTDEPDLITYDNSTISVNEKLFYFLFFAALELVLAFSSFGFIHSYRVAITTLHIPVLLGAFATGRWGGAGMGAIFGLISMWKASNVAFTPGDAIFSPIASPDFWGSIIMGLGMRILFGFCSGWIFEKVKTLNVIWPALFVATAFCTYLHSFLVLLAMSVFFPDQGMNPLSMTSRGLILYTFSGIIVTAICYVGLRTRLGRQVSTIIHHIQSMDLTSRNFLHMLFFVGVIFIVSSSLVIHFLGRVEELLVVYHIDITWRMRDIIGGWGIQFVVSISALSFILFWIFAYFYDVSSTAINRSRRDALTSLYNKEAVEQLVNACIRGSDNPVGAFIMLEIDHFKAINDQHGHMVGDQVLGEVSRCLTEEARENDLVGRMGGDEFCLYIDGYIAQDDLEIKVYHIFSAVRALTLPDGSPVAVSVGVTKGIAKSFRQLYGEADKALYLSKNNGRNCCHYYEH